MSTPSDIDDIVKLLGSTDTYDTCTPEELRDGIDEMTANIRDLIDLLESAKQVRELMMTILAQREETNVNNQ